MIDFFDLGRTQKFLEEDLMDAFRRVLRDGRFIMGPDVAALEAEFATYCGARHAVGVSSGTDALLLALMALDIGPGDEVLVPTLTFFATAGAVARLGATPVFVDVDPDTLLIDVEDARARCTERTRAIIVVHLFGQCAPITEFTDLDIVVIEDAAQAHGARDAEGRCAGSIADIGCFSMFPTKPLGALGDAGMVTTSDPGLADRLTLMRTHGARPKFHHHVVGGNFRLDALQAAFLRVKLPLIDSWTDRRREIAAAYRKQLEPSVGSGGLRLLTELAGHHVYHQFVVRADRRNDLRGVLGDASIGTAIYYPEPLHTQPCFASCGQPLGALPVSEAACSEVLALPCYPGLLDAEVEEISNSINGFYA
ncbi:MAG: dTDP-4-amino-4,6-dideoxygalactose transaminase [Myxococcota bacterium]|jgi:dTDP-4-amino-4,6-dideoxygalactose transaminase